MSISIEVAHKVLEACKQHARELQSPVSIAIVDAGGHLVLFERMMAPYGWATGDLSIAKANTSVMFNQSTDAVAQWGAAIPGFASSLASMTQGKFVMAAGGWPLRLNGVTIGGVGVSGGNAPGRDDEISRAGVAALEGRPASVSSPNQQPARPAGAPPAAPVANYTQPTAYAPSSYGENRAEPQRMGPPTTSYLPDNRNNLQSPYNSNVVNQPDGKRPGDQA